MSLKETQLSQYILPAAEMSAAGLALGFLGVGGVTARHHRELTHKSLEIHAILAALIDWEMRTYSPDPYVWAAVHRIHHHVPDATLYNSYRIAKAIHWVKTHPRLPKSVKVPDCYKYLDPFTEYFSKDDVLEIGYCGEEILRDRMGGSYEPPESFDVNSLQTLFNPTKPMYYYPQKLGHTGEYSQEDIARILLTDPHSPPLMDLQNGVRGVLRSNIGLYSHAAKLFRSRPDLMPKDLQTGRVVDHRKTRVRGFVEGSLLTSGLVLLYRNKYQPEDFLKALLAGTTINTVKLGLHIFGGNVTNSLGHAGVMTPEKFLLAVGAIEYVPILNPDGSVSTDLVYGGALGRVISWLTLGEVGGQREHHLKPDQIAFTPKKDPEGWFEDPWGNLLTFLAENKHFPLIKPGPGFEFKEGEVRPDMPNPAVKLIECRRVEQNNLAKIP